MTPTRPTSTAMTVRRLVVHAVRFEIGIWRSLFRWVLRRPAVPAGAEAFTYHRMVAPVFWLWIFGSAVEIVAVDLLLPWEAVRIVAAALGVWGLAWMVGMLGALTVHPHLVDDDGLRVRHGFGFRTVVPWSNVASVTGHSHDLPSSIRSVQIEESERGDVLAVGVSGRTNLLVRLHEPMTMHTARGDHVVTAVRLWADEHRALVARARQAVAAS